MGSGRSNNNYNMWFTITARIPRPSINSRIREFIQTTTGYKRVGVDHTNGNHTMTMVNAWVPEGQCYTKNQVSTILKRILFQIHISVYQIGYGVAT